jgi:hypothetical protein
MHTITTWGLRPLAEDDTPTRHAPAYGGDMAFHRTAFHCTAFHCMAYQNEAYSATRIAITPTAPALNVPLVA